MSPCKSATEVQVSARDRFEGCLLGLTIGDALGAPYEFGQPMADNAPVEFGPGVFGTAPGEGTDDTALAFILAESLIDRREFVRTNYARRLVEWADSNPPDIGAQTSKAARAWHGGYGPEPDENAQGNGAVMACAAIGLLHAGDPNRPRCTARSSP